MNLGDTNKDSQSTCTCISISQTCKCREKKRLMSTAGSKQALTSSLRRPCIHAIFFPTTCRTAFCFLRVRPEAVSTRHSWLWQTLDDVYTRRCFSESQGTRFGAPGQKALPSGNEWTEWNEWMNFCLIPLSTTGYVEVPGTNLQRRSYNPLSLMPLRNAVCSTGRGLIISRCFGACNSTSCAEERRPQ